MTTSATHKPLGALWPVSPLTLGGGGIAGIWGETTRQEAVQTVQTAVEEGINLIDVAPMYGRGEAESVVGEALQGRLPEGVHVTSKILLGTQSSDETIAKVRRSIGRSLDALKLDRIDLFFLHSNIIPNDYQFPGELAEDQHRWSVTEACFYEAVVPAFEAIQREGLIGAWGITGTGLPSTIMDVLKGEAKPQAVQVIANLLDSPGAIKRFPEAAQPRSIIRTATESGVGVLGIRAGSAVRMLGRPCARARLGWSVWQGHFGRAWRRAWLQARRCLQQTAPAGGVGAGRATRLAHAEIWARRGRHRVDRGPAW